MYLSRLKKRLGINERIYLHLLRHYRATELYGKLSEKEMMQWFGWRTRRMIDVYSHLSETAAVEKYKRLFGIDERKEDGSFITCPRCGQKLPPTAKACWRCGQPLEVTSYLELRGDVEKAKELLEKVFELIRKRPEILDILDSLTK